MLKPITILLFIPLILVVGSVFLFDLPESTGLTVTSGAIAVSDEPTQVVLPESKSVAAITLEHSDIIWQMFPRAKYRIAARVLHSKQYDDWLANFVPVDLALGWGGIGEPQADEWIEWWQSDRWYYYRLRRRLWSAPLSQDYIREHSANVHVVPANANVAMGLQDLENNDLVFIEGMLVDVEVRKDYTVQKYYTSLTRADEGDDSCEIMYVERLVTEGLEYR